MKTVVVTGATSGIGFAVCRELLREGFFVIGIGRSDEKCANSKKELSESFPDCNVEFFTADLMRQSEIKVLADKVGAFITKNCNGELHALINNAGCVRSWYTTTEDGYEQQFALNHLSSFLLTYYLLPFLNKAGGRVIMTSSRSHKMMKIRWKDIMFKKHYNPLMVYKQSKLCNMLFAYALNDRYSSCGISAYGVDPGLVNTDIGQKQTGGIVKFVWSMRKKHGVLPEIPAKTYAWLCLQEENPPAIYYYLCREQKHSKQVTRENADRLFRLSEQLCGIKYGRLVK
ncbi:MAG TPA: short-chain dehydrogenase [Clostridiales bacterium]|nr:SDR family NAD(P)-dependent oxidoreductase [Eubacteriales bacterium]HBR32738.1 short-chain dehydrogenase [Clostridiales bacterium]